MHKGDKVRVNGHSASWDGTEGVITKFGIWNQETSEASALLDLTHTIPYWADNPPTHAGFGVSTLTVIRTAADLRRDAENAALAAKPAFDFVKSVVREFHRNGYRIVRVRPTESDHLTIKRDGLFDDQDRQLLVITDEIRA